MTPANRLDVAVEVRANEGKWWPGWAEHLRQRHGRREVWVRYSTGVGQTRIGWFGADDVRRVQGRPTDLTERS